MALHSGNDIVWDLTRQYHMGEGGMMQCINCCHPS